MNYGDFMYLINIFLAQYLINILKIGIDYYVLIWKITYFGSSIFQGNRKTFKAKDKLFSLRNNSQKYVLKLLLFYKINIDHLRYLK